MRILYGYFVIMLYPPLIMTSRMFTVVPNMQVQQVGILPILMKQFFLITLQYQRLINTHGIILNGEYIRIPIWLKNSQVWMKETFSLQLSLVI